MDNLKKTYDEVVSMGLIPHLVDDKTLHFFDSVNSLNHIADNELRDIAYASKTAYRREHSFPQYIPEEKPSGYFWTLGETVELARLVIPAGNVGIIRRIDTLVTDSTTGKPISQWNDPDSWQNIFTFLLGYNHIGDLVLGNRLIVAPGIGLGEFETAQCTPLLPTPTWNDDRFSWGNPSNKIDIQVPPEIVVRLFVRCQDGDVNQAHGVKGRLVATTQTENSLSAAYQARRASRG